VSCPAPIGPTNANDGSSRIKGTDATMRAGIEIM